MARALVRTMLTDPEHKDDRDTAELLTAELVTNAVEHTEGNDPIEVVLELLPTGCQVEVHDTGPLSSAGLCSSELGCVPDVWQEYGRGLVLIRTLSSACGHRATDGGKTIWFTLLACRAAEACQA
jgi:anti-sigma regulatory factor (Ser/Thr protein kinase)